MNIIDVTPQNVHEETLFCIKDIKKPGFESKRKWFEKRYEEGLRLKILKDENEKMVGFIEFIPSIDAWRPVDASNYLFIHCLVVYSKKDRSKGYGSLLINEVEKEAKKKNFYGLCTMSSKGAWIASKEVFEMNDFSKVDQRGRFELLSKTWNEKSDTPKLYDWNLQQKKYQGWHLIYADQCPWHEKSVFDLLNTAMDFGIDLKIHKIENAQQAKEGPSGYGTFSLLHDGKLIEDHYISATRFRNILQKTLKNS